MFTAVLSSTAPRPTRQPASVATSVRRRTTALTGVGARSAWRTATAPSATDETSRVLPSGYARSSPCTTTSVNSVIPWRPRAVTRPAAYSAAVARSDAMSSSGSASAARRLSESTAWLTLGFGN
ncbi:hypothetical protein KIV56_05275 [Cryobacterium breve]|uniref:Uncharacterized protein n=1 Tax=Cryobacterium breve TaxID=1259258 RepID=A0ABY7NGR4_9MICO|nr:hypothetical protein [Cryobacterium breve]WBM80765.1 hypothetical protein KIV56_05275 [Cryobacterium breve]